MQDTMRECSRRVDECCTVREFFEFIEEGVPTDVERHTIISLRRRLNVTPDRTAVTVLINSRKTSDPYVAVQMIWLLERRYHPKQPSLIRTP